MLRKNAQRGRAGWRVAALCGTATSGKQQMASGESELRTAPLVACFAGEPHTLALVLGGSFQTHFFSNENI
jgi:hypothetical protein